MTEKIGIIYWCFGAGHSSRIIPLAKEFESRGLEVAVAGGGAGKRFVEMNGFDQPGLSEISVNTDSYLKMAKDMVFDALPSTIKRIRDINAWIKKEQPNKLVTDDPLAIFIASIKGLKVYRIEHLEPEILGPFWGAALKSWNWLFSAIGGERVVVTCLWPDEKTESELIEHVGPLAQEGDGSEGSVENYNILMSPGTFGEDFEEIREKLEEEGMSVRTVGDESWVTKKTMAPYTKAADCMICAGFSSIADSVVPGTPTVIYPFIPGQVAIANKTDEKDIMGVETGYSVNEVVEEAIRFVEEKDGLPDFKNGASKFADIVLNEGKNKT